MITAECNRYGKSHNEEHFWIVNQMLSECYEELRRYAKEHPEQTVLYCNCDTRPGYPIPVPETVFEVYTPREVDGLFLGWKIYQYGKNAI